MGFFKNLFTWWDGATTGTALYSWRNGSKAGEDEAGNVYFESDKRGRRWVMYAGSNDISRVPPIWYAWLTRQIDDVPDKALPPAPHFLKAATPNLTGTAGAYRPAGALERGGRRDGATGDYRAWTPD
jgi:NADH:ubiquinone oxidoreductase subunit